jgi:GNAT superfamily N-acetyltransferase
MVSVRPLGPGDREAALAVINAAARWYREFLPPAEYHELEMTAADWEAEAGRMTWYGAFLDGTLAGVMGLEYAREAALLRHAYVLPEHQRRGVGSYLRAHLEAEARGVERLIVGTYARNHKARRALEQAGYRQVSDSAAVLRRYYSIPEDRLRSSVAYAKLVGGGEGQASPADVTRTRRAPSRPAPRAGGARGG